MSVFFVQFFSLFGLFIVVLLLVFLFVLLSVVFVGFWCMMYVIYATLLVGFGTLLCNYFGACHCFNFQWSSFYLEKKNLCDKYIIILCGREKMINSCHSIHHQKNKRSCLRNKEIREGWREKETYKDTFVFLFLFL